MWTNENRGRYDRSRLRYPSDLTDDEWNLVECLIPPGKRGGDKRTVIMREVVKRRITPQIKRDMRRRAAVEPVIGHLKEDHRMGRNYLAHSSGDAINAVLAAVGYNFRLLLRWLRLLLFRILTAIVATFQFRFS